MSDNKNEKDLNQELDNFLGEQPKPKQDDCNGDRECMIKTDKSLVERINKKIITDDGRQLLM
jgi:hypothetical protein